MIGLAVGRKARWWRRSRGDSGNSRPLLPIEDTSAATSAGRESAQLATREIRRTAWGEEYATKAPRASGFLGMPLPPIAGSSASASRNQEDLLFVARAVGTSRLWSFRARLGAGELQPIAEHVEQRLATGDVQLKRRTVHRCRQRDGLPSSRGGTYDDGPSIAGLCEERVHVGARFSLPAPQRVRRRRERVPRRGQRLRAHRRTCHHGSMAVALATVQLKRRTFCYRAPRDGPIEPWWARTTMGALNRWPLRGTRGRRQRTRRGAGRENRGPSPGRSSPARRGEARPRRYE